MSIFHTILRTCSFFTFPMRACHHPSHGRARPDKLVPASTEQRGTSRELWDRLLGGFLKMGYRAWARFDRRIQFTAKLVRQGRAFICSTLVHSLWRRDTDLLDRLSRHAIALGGPRPRFGRCMRTCLRCHSWPITTFRWTAEFGRCWRYSRHRDAPARLPVT
jgi:hypothetical protein